MPPITRVLLLGIIVWELVNCQSKDGYTDENRPYEFGFTIEGEQHRYEKKDEKGIIMGEYGFITADGVYHVTVYATDENGNFKILKTKNTLIGLKMVKPTMEARTVKPVVRTLSDQSGCSGCLVPTTTKSPSSSPKGVNAGGQELQATGGVFTSQVKQTPLPATDRDYLLSSARPNLAPPAHLSPSPPGPPSTSSQIPLPLTDPLSRAPLVNFNQKAVITNINIHTKQPVYNRPNPTFPPVSNSKETRNNGQPQSQRLTPVEKSIMDFMESEIARLYKFNYTLTFHGHSEEGDTLGNKQGSYFHNGRDGYQRKVEYVANQFGYQPIVALVKLDPGSVPNEKTEKDQTELKGNEFIWFHEKLRRESQ